MEPLGTKKSLNLLVQTKSRNLSGQKIMQPLGTTKNHATSWGKKCPENSNLSHNQNPGDQHRSPWSYLYRNLWCFFCDLAWNGFTRFNEPWRWVAQQGDNSDHSDSIDKQICPKLCDEKNYLWKNLCWTKFYDKRKFAMKNMCDIFLLVLKKKFHHKKVFY